MAKCLRCGAGGEWLQGNPPKDQTDYKDRCERLEQALRVTSDELQAIIEAAQLATPRPWERSTGRSTEAVVTQNRDYDSVEQVRYDGSPIADCDTDPHCGSTENQNEANAEYITLAANHADHLAARVLELEHELAIQTDQASKLRDILDKLDAAAMKCYAPPDDYRPCFGEFLGHLVEDAPKWKAKLERVKAYATELSKVSGTVKAAEVAAVLLKMLKGE